MRKISLKMVEETQTPEYMVRLFIWTVYPKIKTLFKKQDNLRYVFKYKILTLCVTQIFMEFMKLAKGRGHFYFQKIMHFALHFYLSKTLHFLLHFYIKTQTLCVTFLYAKNSALCVSFLFIICFELFIVNWSYSYDK